MAGPNLADVNAENALLGNLFYDLGLLPLVADKVTPEAMTQKASRTVYGEMLAMYEANDLDANRLQAALQTMDGFDMRYLDALGRVFPAQRPEQLLGYADAITNAAELRSLQDRALRLLSDVKADADAEQLRAEFLSDLAADVRTVGGLKPLAIVAEQVAEQVAAWQRGEREAFVSTGFADLDKRVKVRPGRLYLIAARPSLGKTQLGIQILENIARDLRDSGDPGCVACFSAEMEGQDLALRLACAAAGVNSIYLENGKASAQDVEWVQKHLAEMRELPFYIDDEAAPTVQRIYFRTAMQNARKPIRAILFDFVELAGDKARSEELRVSAIAQGLKNIAKRLDIPVIAISQLSRAVETRNDKIPQLADLRYSGMLEAIADTVLFLWRWEYYEKRNVKIDLPPNMAKYQDYGVAMIVVAKNRGGPVGTFAMAFLEEFTRFADMARESDVAKYS